LDHSNNLGNTVLPTPVAVIPKKKKRERRRGISVFRPKN
jgi:hypothetical protein